MEFEIKEKNDNIEELLVEFEKYILSYVINKSYDFNNLRNKYKNFCEETGIMEYNDEMKNSEIAMNIKKLTDGYFN